MAAKKVPGLTDGQVLLLNCPTCRRPLDVTNFRTGPLDRLRGTHQVKSYGWIARCPECERQWGDFMNPMVAPSLWVLKDIVEKEA